MSDRICPTCAHANEPATGPTCLPCLSSPQAYARWAPIAIVKAPEAAPPAPEPTPSTGGLKFDQDKPRMDLLDPLWLEETAKVLSFGAKKYAAHNWRQGISTSRLIGAALRHLWAYVRGEDKDPESGLPHLAHASCCLMFLTNMAATRPDLDDRYKANA